MTNMTKFILNLRLLKIIGWVKLGKLIAAEQEWSGEGAAKSPSPSRKGRAGKPRDFSELPVRPLPNVMDFSLVLGPWNWLFRLFYMFVSLQPKIEAVP